MQYINGFGMGEPQQEEKKWHMIVQFVQVAYYDCGHVFSIRGQEGKYPVVCTSCKKGRIARINSFKTFTFPEDEG